MKLSMKQILTIALVALLSFPVVYLGVLFYTGNARLEFGPKTEVEKRDDDYRIINMTQHRDSLLAVQSVAYRALMKQREELQEKERMLKEREERVAMLKQELEQQQIALAGEREKIEKAVQGSNEATEKKIRQLARVYGAMRPAEAAQIMETLSDDLCVKIIRGIGDERQKGKIMSSLTKEKAVRISKIMSTPEFSTQK